MQDKLNTAIANVDSLEKALKIAQVKQDIKDFSKDLNEGIYSGIKDIASSSDRVVSSFSQLRDVMNDVDATEWERIMVVWNAMTNVVDSFLSIVKMIENLTEITNKLTQAKETESVVDTELTGTKVANAATKPPLLQLQLQLKQQCKLRRVKRSPRRQLLKWQLKVPRLTQRFHLQDPH